ncbi:hypothetical protein, partial [uncultured Clostridium sp.]|uniref:hypothetical protein n=1 Tax=uncultured Clostridium sp. TaxID=59620 RepID=UPI002670F39A
IDSWGRSSLIKRKVTVYPQSSLEYNYITIKNNETDDPILTIRFDDKTKKFVVDKIDISKIPSSLKNEDKVFELKLIKKKNTNNITKTSDENQVAEETKTITLTKGNLMDGTEVNKINELSYEEDDYLALWSYDSKDGIFIAAKAHILLNGFESNEKMVNTRFKVKPSGLENIYNESPTITGLDQTLYIYKNDDITQEIATKGLEIHDDTGTISIDSIEITDEDGRKLNPKDEESNKTKRKFKSSTNDEEDEYVETDELKEFTLLYKVTDAWGKSATYKRTVSVISRSVSNDIEFYNENGSENLFSLKYNPISNIFDVSKKANNSASTGSENTTPPTDEIPSEPQYPSERTDTSIQSNSEKEDNQRTENTPNEDSDSSQGEDSSGGSSSSEENNQQSEAKVFKFCIFNAQEQKVKEIELTEEEASNIEKVKEKLKDVIIYDDYYISVWSSKVSRIKIKGEVIDNDKLGESGKEKQDYSQTITNSDYIDNVRFNLTENGIHAIYNKAPKINFLNTEILTVYAGDTIDYTKNIEVKDDRDNPENDYIIDNSKIKISILPSENINNEGTPPNINGSGDNSNGESQGGSNSGSGDLNNESSSDSSGSNQDLDTEGESNHDSRSGNEFSETLDDQDSSEVDQPSTEKNDSNKTEEEKFLEEQREHLKIGNNKVKLTVEDSWGRRAEKEGQIEIRSAMDSNSINIYPKENSTASGSTSESIQQPNQSPENTTEGETSQTRTTEAEGDSENTNHTPGAGGSVTEGTQTPAGSTDGSTETAPGENGGNSNQESSGEGDTTTPGDGNNIDNAVVKNSSFSIKFIRDNEHNKNRIQVITGSNAEKEFDSNNPTGTFLTVKIYDANGKVLKSVDILGSDTGKKAKEKIENELNKVNSDSESKDETKGEETEQPQTKTASDIEDSTESSTNSANGSSQGGGNSSNKNDKQFEYFNGQYIAIEGVTEATMKSVKIQGTVVNKGNDVTYENGVSDIDKIQNVRFKFTDLGLEAVYNKAPTIKIDDKIKLDGTERKTTSGREENPSGDTGTVNTEDFDGIKGDDFNYLRGVTISDDHDTLTKDNVEVKWNNKFEGDTKDYNDNKESVLTDNPDGEFALAENGIKVYGEQRVGDNVLYYKVTDSWGRISYEQRINIKLKNGAFED